MDTNNRIQSAPRVCACRIVASPDAIIDIRIIICVSGALAPILVAITTTKIQPEDITNTCCRAKTIVM
jgi:hypothetical protein